MTVNDIIDATKGLDRDIPVKIILNSNLVSIAHLYYYTNEDGDAEILLDFKGEKYDSYRKSNRSSRKF